MQSLEYYLCLASPFWKHSHEQIGDIPRTSPWGCYHHPIVNTGVVLIVVLMGLILPITGKRPSISIPGHTRSSLHFKWSKSISYVWDRAVRSAGAASSTLQYWAEVDGYWGNGQDLGAECYTLVYILTMMIWLVRWVAIGMDISQCPCKLTIPNFKYTGIHCVRCCYPIWPIVERQSFQSCSSFLAQNVHRAIAFAEYA